MANQDLSVSSLKQGLSTRLIGQNIIYFPSLPSTMEAARKEVQRAAVDGTVIIAGEQTAGRGRLKRTWFSPGGNIALSIILYPDAASLPYLIMIASLATTSAIESVTGLKAQIKWPNDILIKGRKTAGILIENEVKGGRIAYAIIGIGINTGLRPVEVSEIASTATSLETEMGKTVSREDIIVNLLAEFERLYLTLPDGTSIFKAWRDRLVTLGQNVTATWGKEVVRGIAESVDENGALVIRLADGSSTKVVAGDVTLRSK
jgi:BirA family transcriptional regulator, biotin operon repressor / biotin---[acetyl-CoA-carboxylase] ligase